MKIEKFSQEDKNGYKIIGATFASSKNINGAFFDPVEVFTKNLPEKFNFAHEDKTTDYSTGTKIIEKPKGEIVGDMLKFTWDLETTNENFIKLIDSDDFGGFSPELNPINKPLYGNKIGVDKQGKEILERFYRSGDLEWAETAILSKSQKPGFVGANEYQLETFEAILIEKIEEEKPAVEEPKETFSKEDFKKEILEDVKNQIKESFDEIKKSLEPKQEDLKEKEDKEKFEKIQKENEQANEHFNQIAKAKANLDTTKPFSKGENGGGSNKAGEEARKSLIKKLF